MQNPLRIKLLVASFNPGKLREFFELLGDMPEVDLVSPMDLGLDINVLEDGSSYAENAALKAKALAQASGLFTLADDSGLEVNALDGAPGLFSARYSPISGATDADRRDYLLKNLAGAAKPWLARFRAALAIAEPGRDLEYTEGVCEGMIIEHERGSGGFGYDPIFQLAGMGKTMAELTSLEKNRISHRAKAVIAARPLIRESMNRMRG